MDPQTIWKNGAIPARLGWTYLCCHFHQALLKAPAIALGVLSRLAIQDPISPTLVWVNGVSAVSKIVQKEND